MLLGSKVINAIFKIFSKGHYRSPYYLMLIFVEGANCRCLHFCFLVVNALNLFLVQVPCTWTEFEMVVGQCEEVWSRKVNQDSSDLKVIVFSLILLNRSFVVLYG